jgi:hypothetical protein
VLVELGLWIIISAGASLISVIWLQKSFTQRDCNDTVKRRAAITVAIITALFCVLNIAFVCVYSYEVLKTSVNAQAGQYSNYFKISLITIPLNSVLNPAVYVVRKRELRDFVKTGLISIGITCRRLC